MSIQGSKAERQRDALLRRLLKSPPLSREQLAEQVRRDPDKLKRGRPKSQGKATDS
jgi:hypothetical protein